MTSALDPEHGAVASVSLRRRVIATAAVLATVLALAVPVGAMWLANRSGANASDSESVGLNRLGAAKLDMKLGSTSGALTAVNLAPGDTVQGHIDVSNAGDLPFLYAIELLVGDGQLGEWLLLDVWVSDTCSGIPADPDAVLLSGRALNEERITVTGSAASGRDVGDRALGADASERICVVATLPLDAPNAAQGTEVALDFVFEAEHDIDAMDDGS